MEPAHEQRDTEPERVGTILPSLLRQLAATAEEDLAAIRFRLLADRYENPYEEEELAA